MNSVVQNVVAQHQPLHDHRECDRFLPSAKPFYKNDENEKWISQRFLHLVSKSNDMLDFVPDKERAVVTVVSRPPVLRIRHERFQIFLYSAEV